MNRQILVAKLVTVRVKQESQAGINSLQPCDAPAPLQTVWTAQSSGRVLSINEIGHSPTGVDNRGMIEEASPPGGNQL